MASVVAAPEGAVAVVGGASVAATGMAIASTGTMMMANALDNQKAGYDRGQKSSTSEERVNGETQSTKRGREEHMKYNPGEGYILNKALPSGKRPDAYNPNIGVVRELKPNNPRAIKRGQKQVKEYKNELEQLHPNIPWKAYIDTY